MIYPIERMSFIRDSTCAKYARNGGRTVDLSLPLLSVQLSHLVDTGECIFGVLVSHAVGDGRSLARLLKTIDYFCEAKQQSQQLEPICSDSFSRPLTCPPERFTSEFNMVNCNSNPWFGFPRLVFQIILDTITCTPGLLR